MCGNYQKTSVFYIFCGIFLLYLTKQSFFYFWEDWEMGISTVLAELFKVAVEELTCYSCMSGL